jgi:hypothetical protein
MMEKAVDLIQAAPEARRRRMCNLPPPLLPDVPNYNNISCVSHWFTDYGFVTNYVFVPDFGFSPP